MDPRDSQPLAAAAQGPSGLRAAEAKQGLGTLAPSSWSQNAVPRGPSFHTWMVEAARVLARLGPAAQGSLQELMENHRMSL